MHFLGTSLIKYRQLIKNNIKFVLRYSNFTKKPPWTIMFFGTDDFSIYSLKALYDEYRNGSLINKLEVVTNIKSPSNEVQKFAENKQIKTHNWPLTVPEKEYDLGLVVSFGHLIPEKVINQFPMGILNVHASLLPRWRGAAPIIYALANGDTKTGVTIMKIKPEKFDVGDIVSQVVVDIPKDIKMPELHRKLGSTGAEELVRIVKKLPEALNNVKPQSEQNVTFAPKISPDFAVINWENMDSTAIYNKERALTGIYLLATSWIGNHPVKLLEINECEHKDDSETYLKPGFVLYHKPSKKLRVLCSNNTWISVGKIKVHGKKVMNAIDFYNGYVKKQKLECRYFKAVICNKTS